MIKYIEGDLRFLTLDAVAHQCNCFTTMGAGLAKSLANTYTDLRTVDKEFVTDFLSKGQSRDDLLGKLSILKTHNISTKEEFWIFNCYSQFHWKSGQNKTDLDAVTSCFGTLGGLMELEGKRTLGVPDLFGCGLAYGNKDEIHEAIELGLKAYDIDLYYVTFKD